MIPPLVAAVAVSNGPPSGPRMALAYRRLAPRHAHELVAFLHRLAAGGDERLFHPHPFTAEAVAEIAARGHRDEYVVVTAGRQGPVVAYGMLRGWEEGFAVPSLGIAVDRQWRGIGLGRRLVTHLHALAASRGAPSVRLTVYRANAAAVALYRSCGYTLHPHPPDAWLGHIALPARRAQAA